MINKQVYNDICKDVKNLKVEVIALEENVAKLVLELDKQLNISKLDIVKQLKKG